MEKYKAMNILILSAGTRVKAIRSFRQAIPDFGSVIATDLSPLAPALYEADRYYTVPPISDREYIGTIIEICRRDRANGVLSLIDPELSLLALHEEEFSAVGTKVIGSSYDLCEMSLDKMAMYRWLSRHGYRCARSWGSLGEFERALGAREVEFPVFVKPVRGSASAAVTKCGGIDAVKLLFSHEDGLMVQEYLRGQEYGADVYVDMVSGEVVSIFLKKKLRMRAGETDKAESVIDADAFRLIERFVLEAGYRGPVDIDLFCVDGDWYISEVNPRFGGGYPFAYECGCNFPQYIIENLGGKANEKMVGRYRPHCQMAKWSDVAIVGARDS